MSRKRSDSTIRLDYYHHLVKTTILCHQHPVTGLLPATANTNGDAWVRDNVYSVIAVWALSMAYRKRAETDEDRARAYQLERSVVKLMRGLLFCMMRQADKVESFKRMPIKENALHAKYDITNGATCVADHLWGHLQVDATSLYILMLAQMTTSGLQIIFSLDEVSFVQNLVFYIESAYRTPDFGVWERGDKTNQGQPELNASSVGMAKAALEAINEFDLFGSLGGPESVIHVLADERQHCRTIFHSLLPRESSSKEVDSALLTVIGFPAFACNDCDLVEQTREKIENELKGNYGCKRFKRDGYRTVMEDPRRPYYEPSELKNFDNIECEWPVFFCCLLLDGLFHNNKCQVDEYRSLLDKLILQQDDLLVYLPELYYVPRDKVDLEKATPHSQERLPGGKVPHLWGQSLYIVGCLLQEGLIVAGELDPLNRHYYVSPKVELVVQVALVAEDEAMKQELSEYDIPSQTSDELSPIRILLARQLSKAYTSLGRNDKLGLSGRAFLDMGTLSTCKLYRYKQTMYAFFPQFLDHEHFYLSLDDQMTVDFVQTALAYLRANWEMNGRPTFTLPVTRFLLGEQGKKSPVINLLKKLRAGYSAGVRTKVGKLADFLKTSHITKLSFMHGYPVVDDCALSPVGMKRAMTLESSNSLLSLYDNSPANPSPRLRRRGPSPNRDHERIQRRSMVIGSVRRSRRAASRFFDDELDGAGSPKSIMNLLASQSHGGKRRSLHLKHSASPAEFHSRSLSTGSYGGVQMDDLLEQLAVADSLQDQADILYCIYLQKGLHFDCKLNEEEGCTVGVLYEEIYERAAHQQLWSLVRHAAGVVGKEVEELAAAATDILVHQKQFTVGLPPATVEITVTRPLPPEELKSIIYGTYGEDVSTAVLTQEILLYLAMFMRTTPSMFLEMLTLRIGLIIHVMTAELGRSLTCKGDEAAEQLMNLRPSQMKKLLYHIINGEEFTETIESTGEEDGRFRRRLVTIHALKRRDTAGIVKLKQHAREELSGKPRGANDSGSDDESPMTSLHGQWIRRRRLDGALNRVPIGFYSNVWRILQRCSGLKLDKHILYSHPTIEEMTEGELKFALTVESWLNRLPQPEYRQLMVEALMVLGMLVDTDPGQSLGDIVSIGSLVYDANKLFLESAFAGINNPPLAVHQDDTIVEDFYDCAPSGRFGTMSFLTQAVVNRVQALPRIAPLPDCRVS